MSDEVLYALVASVLLLVAGVPATVLTRRLISAVNADEPIGISGHWGGLGGGTGGWRLSPGLVSLLGATLAWLLLAAVGLYCVRGARERERQRIERDDALAVIEREERHRREDRDDERARIEREEHHRREDRAAKKDMAISADKADQKPESLAPSSGASTPNEPVQAARKTRPPAPLAH